VSGSKSIQRIAGAEAPGEAARHMERERRHILAEDDLTRRFGVVKIGHALMSLVHQLIRRHRGGKITAEIGVFADHGFERAVDHHLRHLGAGRIVEIYTRLTAILQGEGRELGAERLDRETGFGHDRLWRMGGLA
jgi:hypothetical protein